MSPRTIQKLLPLLLLGFAQFAEAQVFEVGGFGGAWRTSSSNADIGSTDSLNPSDPAFRASLDNRWLFGIRMTLNSWDHFGQEFSYAYHRTAINIGGVQSGNGTTIHTVSYGLLAYATPEGSRVRPFVQGGGGFSNFIQPGGSVSRGGGDNKFGFFYGGGVKFKVRENWLMRFDFRQLQNGKPFDLPDAHGLLRRNEFSIGVSYTL